MGSALARSRPVGAKWAEAFRTAPRNEHWTAALTEARAVFAVVGAAESRDQIEALAHAFHDFAADARKAEAEHARQEGKAVAHGAITQAIRALERIVRP